jgi:hypothetical protein
VVTIPSLGWLYGLGLFFDGRSPEAEKDVVLVEPADTVFSGKKVFPESS